MNRFSFITLASLALLLPTMVSGDELLDLIKGAFEVHQEEMLPLQKEMMQSMQDTGLEVQNQMQLINDFKSIDERSSEARKMELQRTKLRLAALEAVEEYAAASEEDRAKILEEAEAKTKELQRKQRQESKPAQDKYAKMVMKYTDENKAFGEAFAGFFEISGRDELSGLERGDIRGQYYSATVYTQYNENGKSSLRVTLSPRNGGLIGSFTPFPVQRPKPLKELAPGVKLMQLRDTYARVLVGERFSANFHVVDRELWDKDRLEVAVGQLVDLRWIATLEPAQAAETAEAK